MKKIFLFLILSLSLLSLSNYTFNKFVAGKVLLEPAVAPKKTQVVCNGIAYDCKKPVKYLGEVGGCYCYACYGSGKKKTICTKNLEENKKLQKLINNFPRGRAARY